MKNQVILEDQNGPAGTIKRRASLIRLQTRAALGLLFVSACTTFPASAGTPIPPAIAVPPDNTLLLSAFGAGVQIYDSVSDGHGGFHWASSSIPSATLYSDSSEATKIGMHFAGPTWELFADGSSVVGSKIASAASPNPNSIPQLLLSARSHGGTGLLDEVTYIQRLDTDGGLASATTLPTGLGQVYDSPYTATYDFYTSVPDTSSPVVEAVVLIAITGLGGLSHRNRKHLMLGPQ